MRRRTQVFLTDEQYAFLHAEKGRTGLSVGTLVRRAIDETYKLEHRPRLHGWQASVGWWRHPDAAVVGRRAGVG
ncbi:MAG: hypothetical protein HOQ28_13345 [Thermoleophilia bacterium]|nr:hypothetical protein [Thermoleophilia bacterium]